MDIEIKNAVIKSARISSADHGILDASLSLDYGGTGQVFGGYALYVSKASKHWKLNGVAGHFIWRVMEVAGVTEWSSLVGRTVRVRAEHSKVHAIGHIIKDDWFCPADDFNGE